MGPGLTSGQSTSWEGKSGGQERTLGGDMQKSRLSPAGSRAFGEQEAPVQAWGSPAVEQL